MSAGKRSEQKDEGPVKHQRARTKGDEAKALHRRANRLPLGLECARDLQPCEPRRRSPAATASSAGRKSSRCAAHRTRLTLRHNPGEPRGQWKACSTDLGHWIEHHHPEPGDLGSESRPPPARRSAPKGGWISKISGGTSTTMSNIIDLSTRIASRPAVSRPIENVLTEDAIDLSF